MISSLTLRQGSFSILKKFPVGDRSETERIEFTLYFRFTLQARGQWKHWNDVVKNLDVPEKMTNLAVIPTLDTARLGLLNVEDINYAIKNLSGASEA